MPIDFLLPLYFKPLILLDRIYFEIMILAIKYQELLKSRDITLLTKVCTVKAMVFSSSHVWMWELNHKDWAPKNWYFWTMVLEKTLESSLDGKEIKSVNHKGNQPWILIGRTDAPMFWSPDAKSQLTGKDSDAVKDWGQEKWSTEDKMVRQHHQLNEHEFEQTLGDNGQGSLVCCTPRGCRVGHDLVTEQQPGISWSKTKLLLKKINHLLWINQPLRQLAHPRLTLPCPDTKHCMMHGQADIWRVVQWGRASLPCVTGAHVQGFKSCSNGSATGYGYWEHISSLLPSKHYRPPPSIHHVLTGILC